MDKEHVKGAADKAKGAVKDAAGKMMDDKKLQAEGKMDKAKGSAREALGDAKDAVKRGQGKLGRETMRRNNRDACRVGQVARLVYRPPALDAPGTHPCPVRVPSCGAFFSAQWRE